VNPAKSPLPVRDRAAPFAAFARKLTLPQTAVLALEGPLEVPYSDGGRAWFSAFEHNGTLICPAPGELRRLRSLASTVESLYEALRALVAQGWRYNQLHLFGFGDGGTVRLLTRARPSKRPDARPCTATPVPRAGAREQLFRAQDHSQNEPLRAAAAALYRRTPIERRSTD